MRLPFLAMTKDEVHAKDQQNAAISGSRAFWTELIPACADDWPSITVSDWPFRHKAVADGPNTLTQIARSIDYVEEKILDDGVVVMKKPDVWGQARMTLYRKDFETMMKARGPDHFQAILAGASESTGTRPRFRANRIQRVARDVPSGGSRTGRATRALSQWWSGQCRHIADDCGDAGVFRSRPRPGRRLGRPGTVGRWQPGRREQSVLERHAAADRPRICIASREATFL